MSPSPIAIYGPTGIGKTFDVHRCFTKGYTLLLDPGGLDSVIAETGVQPRHYYLQDRQQPEKEVRTVLEKIVKPLVQRGEVGAVILDTGTKLFHRILETVFVEQKKGFSGKEDPRRAYPQAARRFNEVIEDIIAIGVWPVAIFQLRKPATNDGKYTEGGPDLPSNAARLINPIWSLMLQADVAETANGKERVYRCEILGDTYVHKDRFGVCAEVQEMNLRQIMVAIQEKLQRQQKG